MMQTHRVQRLLIVDDERVITNSLSTIFSMRGYETRGVYSAEAARALIEGWPPDLAIVDVVLPGMNGIQFAILLKAEFPNCRLMLFSGQPSASELLEFTNDEGHQFEILAKPVSPELLLEWAADNGVAAAKKCSES
jgi:DNA-binding NtrC family response regulator